MPLPRHSVEFDLDSETRHPDGRRHLSVERVTLDGTFIGWIIQTHYVKRAFRWSVVAATTLRLPNEPNHLKAAYALVAHHEARHPVTAR